MKSIIAISTLLLLPACSTVNSVIDQADDMTEESQGSLESAQVLSLKIGINMTCLDATQRAINVYLGHDDKLTNAYYNFCELIGEMGSTARPENAQ